MKYIDSLMAVPRREMKVYLEDLLALVRGACRGAASGERIVEEFERRFADYLGTKHAVALSSARLSFRLILEAIPLQGRREVIVPAYTDESVPAAVLKAGLEPVFVDVTYPDGNIDPEIVREKIGKNTAAVIATHLFGRPCDLDALGPLCRESGAHLIEDCAHSLGAKYRGRMAGRFGVASFFSFAETKPFTTFGGGMVATDDDRVAAAIRERTAAFPPPSAGKLARTLAKVSILYLVTRRPVFTVTLYPFLRMLSALRMDLIGAYNNIIKPLGIPSKGEVRFTPSRAEVGLHALGRIDREIRRRVEYSKVLERALGIEEKDDRVDRDVKYFFAMVSPDKDDLARELLRNGVDTGKLLMRDTPAIFGDEGDYPVTRTLLDESLQIPNHAAVTPRKNEQVARLLRAKLT